MTGDGFMTRLHEDGDVASGSIPDAMSGSGDRERRRRLTLRAKLLAASPSPLRLPGGAEQLVEVEHWARLSAVPSLELPSRSPAALAVLRIFDRASQLYDAHPCHGG